MPSGSARSKKTILSLGAFSSFFSWSLKIFFAVRACPVTLPVCGPLPFPDQLLSAPLPDRLRNPVLPFRPPAWSYRSTARQPSHTNLVFRSYRYGFPVNSGKIYFLLTNGSASTNFNCSSALFSSFSIFCAVPVPKLSSINLITFRTLPVSIAFANSLKT